jgi:predicted RNA-binding Zn-ribbon protein involved in translation (DUF1610 family)
MEWPAIWIVAGVAVVAAGAYLWYRVRRERMLHCECPSCGRKLLYKARSAGGAGMCPHCGEKCSWRRHRDRAFSISHFLDKGVPKSIRATHNTIQGVAWPIAEQQVVVASFEKPTYLVEKYGIHFINDICAQ